MGFQTLRVLLVAIFPLISSCGARSHDDINDPVRSLQTVDSKCVTFRIGPDDNLSDAWVGASALAPDGSTICLRDRRLDYEESSYNNILENDLRCAFEESLNESESICNRNVTTQLSELSDDIE